MARAGDRSSLEISDFPEPAVGHVIDKTAHSYLFGNPRMGAQLLQLVANVFVDILKGVKEGWSHRGGSRAILDTRAQVLLSREHEPAIGVVVDHEFFGAQQIVRDDQRTQRVVSDDASGVANDVGVAGS